MFCGWPFELLLPDRSVWYMKRAHSSPQLAWYLLFVGMVICCCCALVAPAATRALKAFWPVSWGLPLLTALAM